MTRSKLKAMIHQAVGGALRERDGEDGAKNCDQSSDLLDLDIATGTEISPALANTIRVRLTEKMAHEVMGKMKELYKTIPTNMSPSVVPTHINAELWSAIPAFARSKDRR